jgi:transcription-repair coupling factor (superfamily II helicase)
VEKIKKILFESSPFVKFTEDIKRLEVNSPLLLRNVSGSLLAFVAAKAFEESGRQCVLIASDEDHAEKLRDDCALLVDEGKVCYFGSRPRHQAQSLDMSASIAQIETLKALVSGTPFLVIASPQSIVEKVPSPESFRQTVIEIHASHEYSFGQFVNKVEESGFTRKNFVESYGDIAVRGGIVDVFPYVGENPLRIEFWGDKIESIREFDVLSQRSIRELQTASIVPALSGASGDNAEGEENNLTSSLFDHLQSKAIILLDEPAIIEREINELFKEGATLLFTYDDLVQQSGEFSLIINSHFNSSQSEIPNPKSAIISDFHSQFPPSFNGSIKSLVETLRKLSSEEYKIFLTSDTEGESRRLQELIEETMSCGEEEASEQPQLRIEYLSETPHSGFSYSAQRLVLFTEHEIFNRLKRRGLAKRKRFKGFSQKELQQLKHGDYVVHIDHGIGIFDGLKKIKVNNVEQEVIKLLFLENDVLYVNLNFINRVQKYSSQEGHVPKLTKLGGGEWEKAKARAKRRIKDIARDIIALYARRKLEKGFAFSPDTHWQRELEASFMYEDTPDQAKATLDVKTDMEHTSPMDRLVCGDVGFGKTEVAVRAAFKAVMDGKQVAVLVPTTILALQHYNTFQDRLSRYTTKVENITRFKSTKEQKKIIEGLKQGSVDIIIGTHRLLSKDIGFKDLGLLVVDEEHRFGVTAKEKLRQLKAAVDTLAMTATPIPRTLHFSLIGARDLSLITTPPRNRIPILTEIIAADTQGRQRHWQVIREAVLRELHRGGQVFFVHDRVNNIQAIADQVRQHIPEAKAHIAHGQMSGHELEKTMFDFLEKKYDVLVCTKIIESGLDIPSVNTIIINRADMFGLAELYQLRGRVGRSTVQAYAYLLTPPLSIMPKSTLRRLQAIEEFTELGSGFNLAMRDLEIRGAGNLLGGEQSGFIMEMGFEMYERVVREAVEELRAEEFNEIFDSKLPSSQIVHPKSPETLIDADIDALIPDVYIESDAERLDMYRRLYKSGSIEELGSMRNELNDRFGEYPEEVEHLLMLVELKIKASQAGFTKLSLKNNTLTVTLPPESDEQFYGTPGETESAFQKIMTNIAADATRSVQLKQAGKELTIQFVKLNGGSPKERLKEAEKKINEICAPNFPG